MNKKIWSWILPKEYIDNPYYLYLISRSFRAFFVISGLVVPPIFCIATCLCNPDDKMDFIPFLVLSPALLFTCVLFYISLGDHFFERAKKIIETGRIYVDGKAVDNNADVLDEFEIHSCGANCLIGATDKIFSAPAWINLKDCPTSVSDIAFSKWFVWLVLSVLYLFLSCLGLFIACIVGYPDVTIGFMDCLDGFIIIGFFIQFIIAQFKDSAF